MASSFAEYILRKSYQSGGKLVGETISHFKIKDLEEIKGIIDKAGLKRNGNKISTLTELRNECEHNLYSDASYIFLPTTHLLTFLCIISLAKSLWIWRDLRLIYRGVLISQYKNLNI